MIPKYLFSFFFYTENACIRADFTNGNNVLIRAAIKTRLSAKYFPETIFFFHVVSFFGFPSFRIPLKHDVVL